MLATIAFIQLFNCDLIQFLELEPNYEGLSVRLFLENGVEGILGNSTALNRLSFTDANLSSPFLSASQDVLFHKV